MPSVANGRAVGVPSRDYQIFLDVQIFLAMRLRSLRASVKLRYDTEVSKIKSTTNNQIWRCG